MKTLTYLAYPLVVVASLAAASMAFAAPADFVEHGDVTIDNSATRALANPKTRAQVQAELLQARADGSSEAWSYNYNPLALAQSLKTRAEVRAEVDAQYDRAMYGEDSGSFALSRVPAVRQSPALFATGPLRTR
jgi:hypothetical protein